MLMSQLIKGVMREHQIQNSACSYASHMDLICQVKAKELSDNLTDMCFSYQSIISNQNMDVNGF
jgi:hypothetical protein